MTYFEENPAVAKAHAVDKSLDASRAREAARKARDNRPQQDRAGKRHAAGQAGGLLLRNDPSLCEIYIVEGDSAGGSAKDGRDRALPGHPAPVGQDAECGKGTAGQGLRQRKADACGDRAGLPASARTLTSTKLRYHKIIIMADADVDGAHIRTLLLTFFFRYMKPLVEGGYIYLAQPPLFKVQKGKKFKYAFSDEERDRLIEEMGGQCDIQRYKGLGEMDPEQLWETTMDPEFRIMLRVTVEDAQQADETFSILMGDNVEPRREFIEKNAKYVQNLDI